MSGQALVTINDNQWSVNVASSITELTQGLSGVASIPAGTGMLFVLPATQVVTVDTTKMLFPLDIIFIKDGAVLDIASNIQPGYFVEEATPIDMFLEVNALEAATVEVEDTVDVELLYTTIEEDSISSIIGPITQVMVLFVVFGMLRGMMGTMLKPPEKKPVKRLGEWEIPPGYEPLHLESSNPSSNPSRRLGNPKTEKERKETHYGKYGSEELPEKGSGREEYYWEIIDIDTGEIFQKGKPYTTKVRAMGGAESFQKGRIGEDKEHSVVMRVFDNPNMEEWGKTIRPVMEIGMRHGMLTEIGKTPAQKAALDRLWPYSILEIHSDGDLTVSSAGKKWVVTTEGGVFVHYTGEEALGRITSGEGGRLSFSLTKPNLVDIIHDTRTIAFYEPTTNIVYTDLYEGDPLIQKVLDYVSITFQVPREALTYKRSEALKGKHSIHGEPHLGYEDWRQLGNEIKYHDPSTTPAVNTFLNDIAKSTPGEEAAKRYLVSEAWRVGVKSTFIKPYEQSLEYTGQHSIHGEPRVRLVEPTGEYTWRIIDKTVGEIHTSTEIYNTKYSAEQGMIEFIKELGRREPSRTKAYEFEIISTPSGEVARVIMKGYISPTGKIEAATEYGPYYRRSIHGEPRVRLVEQYGSWAVGRAEAVCPEEDVSCVEREAKRLMETLRSRYGEAAMTYIKITDKGKSVFYVGDTVSLVAFERENKRLRDIGEKEATGEVAGA